MEKIKNRPEDFEPKILLQRELAKRCSENPAYSLRSFARSLGVSPTVLSLVLSGKRPLSKKACDLVAEKLVLSPLEKSWLLSFRTEKTSNEEKNYNVSELSMDTFSFISEWYHYGILSLLSIEGSKLDPAWVSKRLGISHAEAKKAIETLLRLDLIEKTSSGWKQKGEMIKLDNTVSSSASKKFNLGLLEKAEKSITEDSFSERSIGSAVFEIDQENLEELRSELREIRRKLITKYKNKGNANRVYCLSFQAFPLSERVENEEIL